MQHAAARNGAKDKECSRVWIFPCLGRGRASLHPSIAAVWEATLIRKQTAFATGTKGLGKGAAHGAVATGLRKGVGKGAGPVPSWATVQFLRSGSVLKLPEFCVLGGWVPISASDKRFYPTKGISMRSCSLANRPNRPCFALRRPAFAEAEAYVLDSSHQPDHLSYNHLGLSTAMACSRLCRGNPVRIRPILRNPRSSSPFRGCRMLTVGTPGFWPFHEPGFSFDAKEE